MTQDTEIDVDQVECADCGKPVVFVASEDMDKMPDVFCKACVEKAEVDEE